MKPRWQLGIFAVALLFRVWALIRLARTPLLDSLRSDSEVYWRWAALLRQQGWIGHQPFFLAPLYPYWLALVQLATGHSVLGVLLVQSVLGAAAIVLLADAAGRLTSPRAGLAIGLLAAGYESAIFFDSLVLMESLLFTLECLLLWVVARWPWSSRPLVGAVLAAAIIGTLAYGRGTELLLLVPLWLLLWRSTRRREALTASVAATLVIALLALPGLIRHRALVGEWIPYTYSGGMNLYIGNGPQANGTYSAIEFQDNGPLEGDSAEGGVGLDGRAGLMRAYGVRLSPAASSRYFTRLTGEAMRRDPLRWAQLLGVKLLMLFNLRDEPQVESLALHHALIGPLGVPILSSFGLVALLGILGLIWVRPWEERWIFPVGTLCVTGLGILAFFVVDRYRHHLVPALLLLGAAALQQAFQPRGLRGQASLLRTLCVAVAACALVFWPLPAKSSARLSWDLATRLAEAWLQKGRPDLALVQFDQAIAQDQGALEGAQTLTGRTARALVFENRAIALWQLGRLDEAARSLEQGIALDPQPGVAMQKLFELHVLRGDMPAAEDVLARVSIPRQQAAGFLLDRARAEAGRQSGREIPYLRGVVALDSTSEVGSVALVRALVQRGETEEARAVLNRAERAGIDPPLIDAHRAWIAAREGRLDEARSWLAKVPAERRRTDPRLAATLALIRASAPALLSP